MSLFSNEDIITNKIESWKGFVDSLKYEGVRKLFLQMLSEYHKYVTAVNVKGEPFPTETLITALLLSQHKTD